MIYSIDGCIYPKCEDGFKCPLSEPPSHCDLDLNEDDKIIMELEKKVREGKEAARELSKIKAKIRNKIWCQENKEERRAYARERYHIRKNRKANDIKGNRTNNSNCNNGANCN